MIVLVRVTWRSERRKISLSKKYFREQRDKFSVVSLYVKFSNVLVIGRPLEDGQPRVVDPALTPLSRLEDVLAVQLGRHVCRFLFLWKRSDEPLYINLKGG